MNVEELKQRIDNDPSIMKKLMFMGSHIRGSKAFWKSRSGELRDMIEQLGLPTIFLTMSAADLFWPDLFRLLCNKDISQITMRERRILIQENPLIADLFFQHRLECFVDTVLEPEFQVVDFWYRIEYQHRGSPHVHGLYWCKNAVDVSNIANATDEERKKISMYFDKLVSAVLPDKDCPMPDQHPCEVRFENVTDVDESLSQLLKSVQRHTCSKAYIQRTDKKTKQTVCRFHFPKEIRDHSEIIVNPETGEVEFLPKCNDEKLNKFHPFIISTWRANIDIAPVLSKKAVVAYLTKYVTKSEVGSDTLKEICSKVCSSMVSSEKATKAIQKVLIKNCVERDISAQEVCHILMGAKLYSASGRKFVVVFTKETAWVPLECNEVSEVNNNSENREGKTFLAKYKTRPEQLCNVSLYNCAKYYNSSTWKKLKKRDNIVRVFPRLTLSDNEEKNELWYRQQVLLHVPFVLEDELKVEGEYWKNVYDRQNVAHIKKTWCFNNVNVEPGEAEEIEMLCENDERNGDWMIASRLCASSMVQPVELGSKKVDVNHDWHSSASKYESFGNFNFFKNFIENEKKKDDVGPVVNDMPDVIFSAEQNVKMFLGEQIKAINNCNEQTGLHRRVLVQGKAGKIFEICGELV
ncbi:hypothetical protein FOCC_FOCC014815 [Frankliniella occidentalis]|nr:hypothetical protein FOCC_FOCC014815 [Frankliniella occidentalis]